MKPSHVVLIGALLFAAAAVGPRDAGSEGAQAHSGDHAAGSFTRLDLSPACSGPAAAQAALEKGLVRPLALAAADLDEDGVPDLIAGYDTIGGGILSTRLGNPDAIYPNSPEARERRARGTFTGSPFLAPASLADVPLAPDFLVTGDFDADGHQDVLVAARGGGILYVLKGNGQGELAAPGGIPITGGVTSLVAGEIGRPTGLPAVIVGLDGETGPRLLVFDSPAGALAAPPQSFPLPNRAEALLLGRIDEDDWIDLAVAAGGDVYMLGGRDQGALSLFPLVLGPTFGAPAIRSIVLGDFGDDGRPDLAELTADGALTVLPLRGSPAAAGEESGPREIRPAAPGRAGGTLLLRAHVTGRPGDDLVLLDDAGRGLAVLAGPDRRAGTARRAASRSGAGAPVPEPWGTIDLGGRPVAALPMRLNPDALDDLVILLASTAVPITAAPVTTQAALTVTNTGDTGAGSLRQAILDANTTTTADTISFSLPGSGPYLIQPRSALPPLTFPVTIDGTTQPGFAGTPIVQLDGSLSGNGVHGLVISGGTSTVRGLVIGGFGGTGTGDGLHLQSLGNDIVENNFIGIDASGTAARSNTGSGIVVDSVAGNTIGGALTAARNVVSGNAASGIVITGAAATGNIVEGNLIGTRSGGGAALGNGSRGVFVDGAPGNTIGLSNVLPNVISGNGGDGVLINGSGAGGSLLRGNYIGTDITGAVGVRNGLAGIRLLSTNATVGGGTVGQRNLIGFNGASGVVVIGGTGNRLTRNGIFSNVGLGIDLGDDGVTTNDPGDADSGANTLQNYPILTSAITDSSSSTIAGTFNSRPSTSYTIELFTSAVCDTSGFGEGKQFFTSTTLSTDASGNAPIALSQPVPLPVRIFLSATATDPAGNTSEYSNCVRVSDQTPAEITAETWTGTTRLDWTAVTGATSYTVYRGQRNFLPNLVNSARESCLRLTATATTSGTILTETPVQGSFYWYLIAGVNSFGEGTVGDATSGPRVLDSFGACPTCAHEKCVVGGPLSSGCDPCVGSICASNPSCCTTQWTSTCVGQVLAICGSLQCQASAGACPHAQCITGGSLPAGCDSPPVNPSCVATVCGADPVCCSSTWDSTCVEEVGTACLKACN